VKAEHRKPAGMLQPLPIPEWKWESISMDFITGLPSCQGKDSIWVIVDRLTKSAHFLAVKTTMTASQYAEMYVREIVRLHGTPKSIVSDRGSVWTSQFWRAFQKDMSTRLDMSSAFHPQTDGQTERVNQVLEDMLRACVLDFHVNWVKHLPLVEFAYNNSYHSTIGMAPFEALYGRPCRSPTCWAEYGDKFLHGTDYVRDATEKMELIKKRIQTAQSRQKSYYDKHKSQRAFEVGSKVLLKVSPIRGVKRFGKKGKLSPRFVGPFEILERIGEVAYRLQLPERMAGVHNVFHVSMLRKHLRDDSDSQVLDTSDLQIDPDMSFVENPVRILARDVKKTRRTDIPIVKVQWSLHGPEDASWVLEEEIRKSYPHLLEEVCTLES
jgi:hypothetical protein